MPDTVLDASIRVDVPALLAAATAAGGAPFYPMLPLTSYGDADPVGEVLVELHANALADVDASVVGFRYRVTSYAAGYGDQRAGLNLGPLRLSAATPDTLADALHDLGLLVLDRDLNRVGAAGISIVGDPEVLAAVLASMSEAVRTAGITYDDKTHADGIAARERLAATKAAAAAATA